MIFDTLKKIVAQIWVLFLSGLFTILPLTLTLALFSFSFKLLKNWLSPIQKYAPDIPHAEVVVVIIAIILFGLLLKTVLISPLVHLLEQIIMRIPLVRPIYTGLKQLIRAFSAQDHVGFKHVVVLEFPRVGVYSLGFLTGELPAELAPTSAAATTRLASIFIPHTPNPTSGSLIIVPTNAYTIVNLTRQEAMALIISGGIIQPDRLVKDTV